MLREFVEPTAMVDRELSLVEPSFELLDELMRSSSDSMTRNTPTADRFRRGDVADFLTRAPRGREHASSFPYRVQAYTFWMKLTRCDQPPFPNWGQGEPPLTVAGAISLRISDTHETEMYFGHIGYHVFPRVRGNAYACRACRLLFPLIRAHEISPVWITCNPDNFASRRTCEKLGAKLVDIVPLPPENMLYRRGERFKCRYRLDVS